MTEKGKALYMAMEITNNYRNHAINHADFAKKVRLQRNNRVKDEQQGQSTGILREIMQKISSDKF